MADIPDLNDPNTRLGRDAAMDAMRARRRETVMKDMDPDEAAALAATPLVTTEKKEGTDEDTDAGDAAAQAERARLEAEAAKTVEAVPAKTEEKPAAKTDDVPVLDAAKQAQVQTDTDPLLLTDDDLKAVKVKMVVNGQERLVTGAELLAEAQKVAGADDYLKLAKQVLGAAREAPVTPAVTTPAKVADEPAKISAEMEADIDAAVDAVFTGKDDDVKANLKKALLKLTPSAKPAEVTANQLREMEQYLVTRSELRQFAKDHKAIVDDEIGRRICDEFGSSLGHRHHLGGYMFSETLSDVLRFSLQPLVKFRQFADIKDAAVQGKNKGEGTFHWNVYSDVATQGTTLAETRPCPRRTSRSRKAR
jgi:hypothetical protein